MIGDIYPAPFCIGLSKKEECFMKQPIDLARRFLALADQDIKTFEVLIESDEIADSQIGFHAQQAVEKCLKAILTLKEVEFRKTMT